MWQSWHWMPFLHAGDARYCSHTTSSLMPGCTATWWHGVQNSLLRERLEVDAGDVNVLAGAFFVGRRFDFELVLALDRLGHAVAADAAEDGGEDVAGFDAPLAVRFAVDVLHAVAGDARDAFAGRLGQVPQRLGARGAQRRSRPGRGSACRSSRPCLATGRSASARTC